MTTISVDLDNYTDDIKEYYCNGNCLNNYVNKEFTENFKRYVYDLDNDLYIYQRQRSAESILYDLKGLCSKLG